MLPSLPPLYVLFDLNSLLKLLPVESMLLDCTEVMRQSYSLYLGLYLTSHEMVLGLNLQGFWGGKEELRH